LSGGQRVGDAILGRVRLCRLVAPRPTGRRDRLGEYAQAIDHCTRALELLRKIGDQRGAAHTLDGIGYAHQHLHRYRAAADSYREASELFEALGDVYDQAETLGRFGEAALTAGDPRTARTAWHRAAQLFDQLGHSHAAEMRANLSRLDQPA